jgi:ATP-binding cassette subfamily C protein
MRLILIFLRRYPLQSAITLAAILIAGLVEGFGLSLLLPLLALATEMDGGSNAGAASGADSTLAQIVNNTFGTLGITPTIGMLLIIFVACMTVKALLMLATNKRIGYTVAQVATDLRLELIQAFFATRWEYFISQRVGALANSFGAQAGKSSMAYLNGIRMIAAGLHAIIYGTIVFLISWEASVLAFAAGILILLMVWRFIQKSKHAGKRRVSITQSLQAYLTESLIMIKPLKTMARENFADALLQQKTEKLKKVMKKLVFNRQALAAIQEPLTVGFTALGLYGVLVIWKMPLASVLVMVYMLSKVMKKVQKVQGLYQQVVTAESAYWSYKKKLQKAINEKESGFGKHQPTFNRSIQLKRVSFSYANRWVLKDAEFYFPANSFTVIEGPSGVGKTTIVDLITGLLRPQKGEVFIDDIPLAEIDLRVWRQMVGYVPQETLLFNDTVFVNVTLGDKELTVDNVEHALRIAGAWEFIQALPGGLKSKAGERGHKFSGGQRQRIAIARALVHKPRLLLLDEATTAIDPENEAAICETMRKLRGKLTILAISHQSAILDVADRSYRLENGKAILMEDGFMAGTEKVNASAVAVAKSD